VARQLDSMGLLQSRWSDAALEESCLVPARHLHSTDGMVMDPSWFSEVLVMITMLSVDIVGSKARERERATLRLATGGLSAWRVG
jgi:hypothetical protein